jgi:hypothetical protein
MASLILALNDLWPKLNAELLAFAEFLEKLAAEGNISDL